MYSKTDFEQNAARIRKELLVAAALMLPFLAGAVAAFILRVEIACTACVILAGAILIFLWDLRIGPLMHYKRFLKEIHSGLSRRTAGALVKIGQDPVYQDGVDFYEVIINIYEDLSEDGERRFLLDCQKEIDASFMNRDIVLTSHGNMVLDAELLGAAA